MMNVSIEKKKAEAVRRMRELGIYGPTIRQFEKQGLLSRSEPPLGAYFTQGRKPADLNFTKR